MGVHELGLRRAILAEIDKYKERQEDIRRETKLRKLGESKVRYIGHSLTHTFIWHPSRVSNTPPLKCYLTFFSGNLTHALVTLIMLNRTPS